MIELGRYNTLKIDRKVSIGLYLEDEDGEDVLLPLKYVPKEAQTGDHIEVFVYLDNEERPIATTLKPKAVRNEFAYLQVKDITSMGAFLDWGVEKDLFVPFAEQKERMKKGNFYIVYIYLDEMTQRLTASSKWQFYTEKENIDLQPEQEVDILIANPSDLGFNVIINNRFAGMLYKNEIFKPLHTGMREKGYVKKIRPDNKIDISLQRQGFAGVEPNSQKILEELRKNNGFLSIHDKSDPDLIQSRLQMSKKAFKKAVGGLYKERLITIDDDGIRLL